MVGIGNQMYGVNQMYSRNQNAGMNSGKNNSIGFGINTHMAVIKKGADIVGKGADIFEKGASTSEKGAIRIIGDGIGIKSEQKTILEEKVKPSTNRATGSAASDLTKVTEDGKFALKKHNPQLGGLYF